ncbi:MAG TPA: hypothetical protein VGS62_03545 [Streptosporangiaceae bacterium]|nr:hypothetical protein [Streptosporangiaceae bacterium]
MVFPDGFQFTSLILFDPRSCRPPAEFTQFPHERDHKTWLEIRYADGRHGASYQDYAASDQPQELLVSGQPSLASWDDGWIRREWWVTPLPPPGPVDLAIHVGGEDSPSGTGRLNGALLADAARSAEVLWPDGRQE